MHLFYFMCDGKFVAAAPVGVWGVMLSSDGSLAWY